jgi:threonine/homoserine/homoserine lactone efflux protein
VVTIVQAFTCGILLTGLIWFVSMNFVFELEKRQRRYLAQINWFMSGLGKLLIVILLSNPR